MTDELSSAPKVKISWLIGVVAAFAIFAVIALYSSRMANDTADYDQGRADVRKDNLKKVQEAENLLLEPVEMGKDGKPTGKITAEWVDQTKGTVRLPIEEAMAKQVELLKAKPAVEGAEIPGAASAQPAPAAPAEAAPAPSAPAPVPGVSVNSAPAKPAKSAKNASAPAAPVNAAPAPAAPPASTNSAPAKPAEPPKTTFNNKPVFKTRPINTKIYIRNYAGEILAVGSLIREDSQSLNPNTVGEKPNK